MKLVEGSIVVNEEAQHQMGDYMWILDPIDGTTNYVSFHENFAVSLAFYVKKQPVFGIVYDVMKEEMFHAYTGKGILQLTKTSAFTRGNIIRKCMGLQLWKYYRFHKEACRYAFYTKRKQGTSCVRMCIFWQLHI